MPRLVTTTRAGRRERAPLADLERGGGVRADPGFRRQRVMHERDEPQARGFPFRFLRHRAEREAVGEHERAVVDRREQRDRASASACGVGERKAVVQFADGRPPIRAPTGRRRCVDRSRSRR